RLLPDRRELSFTVSAREQQPRAAVARSDDYPTLVVAERRVFDEIESERVDEEPDRRVVVRDDERDEIDSHAGSVKVSVRSLRSSRAGGQATRGPRLLAQPGTDATLAGQAGQATAKRAKTFRRVRRAGNRQPRRQHRRPGDEHATRPPVPARPACQRSAGTR